MLQVQWYLLRYKVIAHNRVMYGLRCVHGYPKVTRQSSHAFYVVGMVMRHQYGFYLCYAQAIVRAYLLEFSHAQTLVYY